MTRLFVCLHPPRGVARGLLRTVEGLVLPAHRLTPLDQVHLTLAFLGEVPDRELGAVIESVTRAAAGVTPFELRPAALIALPNRDAARSIAAATDTPAPLGELRARLVTRLVRRRRSEAPFRPHLTLCRFRAPGPLDRELPALDPVPFAVEGISVQCSVLRPDGAEHRQVAYARLAARPGTSRTAPADP